MVSGDYQRKFVIEEGWDIEFGRLYGSKWRFFLVALLFSGDRKLQELAWSLQTV